MSCFRGATVTKGVKEADWGRHGDYCVKVQQKIRKKMEAKKAKKEMK